MRTKRIEFHGVTMRVYKSDTGIILVRGCRCGRGLLINNGTNTGICVWENKEYPLSQEFLDELRNTLTQESQP